VEKTPRALTIATRQLTMAGLVSRTCWLDAPEWAAKTALHQGGLLKEKMKKHLKFEAARLEVPSGSAS